MIRKPITTITINQQTTWNVRTYEERKANRQKRLFQSKQLKVNPMKNTSTGGIFQQAKIGRIQWKASENARKGGSKSRYKAF